MASGWHHTTRFVRCGSLTEFFRSWRQFTGRSICMECNWNAAYEIVEKTAILRTVDESNLPMPSSALLLSDLRKIIRLAFYDAVGKGRVWQFNEETIMIRVFFQLKRFF